MNEPIQAFPRSPDYPGMSLRDYFAAQALLMVFVVTQGVDNEISNEAAARVAYNMADCMLAERSKP